MKKNILILHTVMISLFMISHTTYAQRGYIRSQIRDKIEKDQEAKHRERGREEIKKVSYENDSRFPDPQNRVEATFEMAIYAYNKKGEEDKPIKSKLIFGKYGECMVMNMGEKEEMRLLYDYNKKATFVVNPDGKTATQMPIMNIKKMGERMSKKYDKDLDAGSGKWERTSQQEVINGYNCRKYIYTGDDGATMDSWVTNDIKINISENYLFGSRIKDYSSLEQTSTDTENLPSGMMVRSIGYDKKTGKPSFKSELISFKNSSEESYFNLEGYEVLDILNKL